MRFGEQLELFSEDEMKNHERDKVDSILEHAVFEAVKSAVSYVENGMIPLEAETKASDEALDRAYERLQKEFPFK